MFEFQLYMELYGTGFLLGTDLTVAEIKHALPLIALCQEPSWPQTLVCTFCGSLWTNNYHELEDCEDLLDITKS